MSFLIKHIDNILTMDWQTLAVLAVLCAFAAYFIKEYLANPSDGYICLSGPPILRNAGTIYLHSCPSFTRPRNSTNG